MSYQVDGRRIRETTKTKNKKQAQRCLDSRVGDIAQGKFKLTNLRSSPPFKSFLETYLEWAKANKRSYQRDEIMVRNLMPLFGHLPLNRIEPLKVERYKSQRVECAQAATVNREVPLLKRMLNLAVEWRLLDENNIIKAKKFKEPPPSEFFLTYEECRRLIAACIPPFQWIVITALNTGMRRNEILSLKWQNVNLNRRIIRVVLSKNGEARSVPLNDEMMHLFKQIPKKSEYVFAQNSGKPYSWIGRAWRNALKRAELKCRFHDLRHTYASHLVQEGVSLLTIQKLLGHKSLQMVQRYAHLGDEHLLEAVQRLEMARSSHANDTVLTQPGAVVPFPIALTG